MTPLAELHGKKVVSLTSGGLDSTTAMYAAHRAGAIVSPLFIYYGQRHSREIASARKVCEGIGLVLTVIELPRNVFGDSSLLSSSQLELPFDRSDADIGVGVPSTFVPGRNLVFLSLAVSYAMRVGAGAVITGFNAVDYSGYPDCRPEFVGAFLVAAGLAVGGDFDVVCPLIGMSKPEIVWEASQCLVPFEDTWSCYSGGDTPCMRCDSCILRENGFAEAGIIDPIAPTSPEVD